MEYIKLGATGLDVSPIAIGAMTYGDPDHGHPSWSLPEEQARPLIKYALDAGINFFDTANLYSNGSSEEILGRALRDFADRDDVVIATKLRFPMRSGPNGKGLSRKEIMSEVEHSLRRLGTDYIDLYQIHRNDPSTPVEETLQALSDLVTAGKVRYLGASSMHAWEFCEALHLQRAHGWHRFVSMQNHYNLLAREEEREMLPLCAHAGVGVIVWSPLARGRLARASENAKATARGETDGSYADLLYTQQTADSDRATIHAVGRIADDRGVSRAQVALAWLHSKSVVTAPLVGASSAAQIDDALASLELELTPQEIETLEAPYTPRQDLQGVSDDRRRPAIPARIPQLTTAAN
jgi:aryl-alcohol dehydrogenase-like predicted oxidoreductase